MLSTEAAVAAFSSVNCDYWIILGQDDRDTLMHTHKSPCSPTVPVHMGYPRIRDTEPLGRLGKSSKIESNHLTKATIGPCPQLPHPQSCYPSRDSTLCHPFSEEIIPNIQPQPLLAQLEALSSHPVAVTLGDFCL